jgi:tetratricopeptide (TPR) repeat protein
MLLEREHELGEFDAAFALATVGTGRLLVLEGHAGIGKSRLIAAARERAEAAGIRVLSTRCSPLEEEFAWGTAVELIEPTLQVASPGELERTFDTGETAVLRLFDRRVVPRPSNSAETAYSIIHGLFWLIADLAERAPLALLVDDAHWSDPSSLRFLEYLLERLEELPVTIVLACRPGRQGEQPTQLERIVGHPSSRTLRVRGIGQDSVSTLVRQVFGDASNALCAACSERTAGNPFYLHELLLALRAEGESAGEIKLDQVQSMALPAVSRAVLVRVGRVDQGAGALARAVAILGDRAELRHAAELAELDDNQAASALDALTSAEVLGVGEPLAFVHPLVGAAIYDDVPAAQRASSHLRAARLLAGEDADPQRVAAQLLASGPRGDEWVAGALHSAARLAVARASPESAARYLTRALEEPPPARLRPILLRELGDAQAMTGQLDAAVQAFDQVLQLDPDPRVRADVQLARGHALSTQGKHLAAADAYKAGLAELEDDTSELARELRVAYVKTAAVELSLRDLGLAALEELQQDPAVAPTRGERGLLAQHAAHAAMAGEPQSRVRELAERAWGDGALLEAEGSDGPTWSVVTGALSFSGQLELGEAICDVVLADARKRGSPMAFATASYCRSYPRFFSGRITEALADVQLALGARREGWEMFLPSAHAVLAWGHIERGELDAAADALAVADDPIVQGNLGYTWLLDARGRLHMAHGRTREALTEFLAAGALAARLSMPGPGMIPWRAGAARAAHAIGDADQARTLAKDDMTRSSRVGAPGMIGRALHTLGLIDMTDDGLELLQQAADTLAGSPAGLEHAHTLVDLGAALRRAGRRTAAQEPLRQGLLLAQKGGASALRERARVELAATGARPRKEVRAGVDSLTPSERRVADMAAGGQTNRQIAQALFVTIKAVEAHLHHTYRKLDIDTRKQLANALADGRTVP